jgi:hypothetical protein
MTYHSHIDFTGDQADDLFDNHKIVTVVTTKQGKEVDRITTSLQNLVKSDFFNTRKSEKTAYLQLKSFLAKQLH